jgi:perosamine synthetase
MRKTFPISQPSVTDSELEHVVRAVKSGWISSMGEFVNEFESGFAEFCGCKHAIGVSNGTVAITLALRAMNIGGGDEVIVPDLSFIATANAVLESGATPIFADIERETLCLDPNNVIRRISARTKAIVPVHLYGHPANMPRINEIARQHGLKVIEDAAEAHGASIQGRRVGGLGDCATFSFYANKILTTGEGGIVTTNDDALAERCRSLRDHAMSKFKRYWHEEPGYNFRLTNMQAAIGCSQLKRSAELLNRRSQILRWYSKHLADISDITLNRRAAWAEPCCWMVCAEFQGMDEESRERLMSALKREGVDSRPYFYPMSNMPYFQPADTPVAHEIYVKGINLPTYFDLTEPDVRTICSIVSSAWFEIRGGA